MRAAGVASINPRTALADVFLRTLASSLIYDRRSFQPIAHLAAMSIQHSPTGKKASSFVLPATVGEGARVLPATLGDLLNHLQLCGALCSTSPEVVGILHRKIAMTRGSAKTI